MADAPEPLDPRDRLVDMLLWETLGNQEPPNLVGQIMRRADAQERSRKLRLVFTVTAAAAMVGLCISAFLWLTRPQAPVIAQPELKTPEEKKTEEKTEIAKTQQVPDVKTPEELEWARGNTVETGTEAKVAVLGGYVHVEAAPNTRVKVEGKDKEEQLFLEKGRVTCEVDKKIGTFAVRTPLGVVNVTGTKFAVRVPQSDGERHAGLKPQQFYVEVSEGTVEMRGEWGRESVHAGSKGGVMTGTISSRGEDGLYLRIEGEHEPVRLNLALNAERKINRDQFNKIMLLPPGAKMQVGWMGSKDGTRELRRIVNFEPVGPQARNGSFQGVITEKSEKNDWIRVRNDAGVNERFSVPWREGGQDKKVLERIARLNKGDKVMLRWEADEVLRVAGIEKMGAGDHPEGERKDGDRKDGERKEGERKGDAR